MFGSSELLWIIIIVLVLLGGPALARKLGHAISESRKITRHVKLQAREIQSDVLNLEGDSLGLATHNLQKSSHLFFLTTFLQPRLSGDLPIMSATEWEQVLGEHPSEVTRQLEGRGLVIRSNLALHLDHKFSVDELKGLLKTRGLALSGRKDELILRLMETRHPDMWEIVSGLRLLQCSEQGTQIVAQFLGDTSKRDEQTIARDLQVPANKVSEWIKWVVAAAIGGIIGNRADDALLRLTRLLAEPSTAGVSEPIITTPITTSVPKLDSYPSSGYSYICEYPPKYEGFVRHLQTYALAGEVVEPPLLEYPHALGSMPRLTIVLSHVEQRNANLRASFTFANLGTHYIAFYPFKAFTAFGEAKPIIGPDACDGKMDGRYHRYIMMLPEGDERKFEICWTPFRSPQITIMFRVNGMPQDEFVCWYLRRENVGPVP